MEIRWSLFIALLLLGVAVASEEEDDVPDAGVEGDEELALDQEETRNLRPRAYNQAGYSNTLPSGFRPTPSLAELAGYQRPQQEQQEYEVPARQQIYVEEQRPPVRAPHRKPQENRPSKIQQQLLEEEEEEKEEPDRLSQLLQQSKFDCVSKNTGYYADQELNCEVFHYCQDNVKHSWICPDGFTFHQVHLICMPPTHDNICQKSQKYHFVNDYLYRPINEEEVQRKPNVSLKYSDRFYPAEVYRDDRFEQEEDEEKPEWASLVLQARVLVEDLGLAVYKSNGLDRTHWFKDGVAYPWSAGVSNLILYPEAANQTLYTRRAARADSGNYTCRLSNETHSETHTVRLEILEKPTDAPKTMFISKDQWVEVGSELRLFCEALIGRSYLADATSDLRWRKVWSNNTEGDLLSTQTEIKTARDDVEDIIGSYLSVQRVSAQDYGTYVCVVHSNDVISRNYVTIHYKYLGVASSPWCGAGAAPWRALALGGAAGALVLLSLLACHRRCTPRLLLAARHARARAATAAHRARVLEKEFDVLVCWTAVDGELVRGALLPTLALKYKYRVHTATLSTQPDNWYSSVVGEVSRCRSVVAVLSPAQYSAPQLLTALRQLRALPVPPVVVLLQDLPKLKREAKDAGESLVEVLRHTRLVAWRHVHERAFWTALRLALPLPPPPARPTPTPTAQHADDISNTIETDDSKNSRSGSLTALV